MSIAFRRGLAILFIVKAVSDCLEKSSHDRHMITNHRCLDGVTATSVVP